MLNRVNPGRLRRELRFSKSKVAQNLVDAGLDFAQARPLMDALFETNGFLTLYGSELILLEKALGLKGGFQAVDLVGELVSVKRVPANTGVSYGYLSKTTAETNLGLVGLGFSDGLPRAATNRFEVRIAGQSFAGIGRIAMDQCVVDLGNVEPSVGAEVSFFSQEFPISEWAEASGFSSLEILGRMAARVTRTWVE
jgi:alanine racemase